MDMKTQTDEPECSVADRVLKTFVEAVADDEQIADVAGRLSSVLLGSRPVTETALRQALFNEKSDD